MKKRTSTIIVALALLLLLSIPAFAQGNVHTAQAGETLSSIAAQYGVTSQAIMAANGIANPNLIYAGQQLTIPGGGSVGGNWSGSYTVRAGDTLTSIAMKFATTAQALVSANNLSSDMIYVGQTLSVPASAGSGWQPPAQACGVYYTVKAGDTLSNIAWRNGVTIAQLKAANNLSGDLIYAGQKLCIPGAKPPLVKPPVKPPVAKPPVGGPPSYKPPVTPPPGYVNPGGFILRDACFAPADRQVAGPVVLVKEVDKWCVASAYQGPSDDGLTALIIRSAGKTGYAAKVKPINGGAVDVFIGESPGYSEDQAMYPVAPGQYEVWIDRDNDGKDQESEKMQVTINPGEKIWLDFSLTSASENPRPRSYNGWSGYVSKNASQVEPGNTVASVLIVHAGASGLPIRIKAEGEYGALCYTGTKPEHGGDACEFGGLWPGKYTVLLDGAEVSVEVYVDGEATVEVTFDRK